MSQPAQLVLGNPFCAARLRPGAIDFVFKPRESVGQLVAALEANAWRGQIRGPHGTGKSTLLTALARGIEDHGRAVKSVTLATRQRRLPREFIASLRQAPRHGVAVVDGIDQLHFWNGWLLKRTCRTHGIGLVVVSHRSAHLPDLYKTDVDEARAWSVVEQLQDGFPSLVEFDDLAARLVRHAGNLREALFDLYNVLRRAISTI